MKHLLWSGLLAALLLGAACNSPTDVTGPPHLAGDTITLASGLKYIDARIGQGAEAQTGDLVVMHYTGWLEDGTRFDTSRQPNRGPLEFRIGTSEIIRGWNEGVPGMRVDGRRRLIVPPHLGYGSEGLPPVIPENATLIFDLELRAIR